MQHERQRVPVTALALFTQDTILSGEGTYLCAYDKNFKRCRRTQVFESQAIHGIIVQQRQSTSSVIVWGGPVVRTLYLRQEDGDLEITLADLFNVHDWILDAAFATSTGPLAALVTAHNALWTLQIQNYSHLEDPKRQASVERLVSGSNCILYSAHLLWLSPSRCLIASGTAFGDVIVWSTVLSDSVQSSENQTHFRFSAHEGSVFGVRLSSHLNISGLACERTLATCSDDRSIRLWNVSDLTSRSLLPTSWEKDTGFGFKAAGESLVPRCIAKAMGHISRIWHIRFSYGQNTDELIQVLSFGEDASVITWALTNAKDYYELSQSCAMRPHSGKNIWSVVLDDVSDLVVTGGADGAISLQGLVNNTLAIKQVPQTLLNGCYGSDNFRSYALVDSGTLVSTTDHGRIVALHCSKDNCDTSIEEISGPLTRLKGYSFVSSATSTAFIGGGDGLIYSYAYHSRRLVELCHLTRKIAGLFTSGDAYGQLFLLATSVGCTTAKLFAIVEYDLENCDVDAGATLELTLPEGFVVTSFAHSSTSDNSYAVLGSRHGCIAIYRYSKEGQKPVQCAELLTQVHGKDAVTALRWVRGTQSAGLDCTSWLLSVGRDGMFAVHAVRLQDCTLELQLVHQLSLPIGPNVEGVDLSVGGNIVAWGFRGKQFIVYDIIEQQEVMAVECGGAHRNWTFQSHRYGGEFVWTKASKLFYANQGKMPYKLHNSGGHGREIKAISISSFGAQSVIATGAEDTDIKLSIIEHDGFKCVHTLRKHNTGIQHLQWHGSYLFSSGGFEEFFVWKVTPGVPHITVGVICESKHPRSGTSDLRIMGFDVVSAIEDAGFVISMAYSDSTLKVWRYLGRSWQLIATADYFTSCLTHAYWTTDRGDEIFTAATDGHIARWSLGNKTRELGWVDRHAVHQSAIHEVVQIDVPGSGASLIVTGGDDNAIGITRIGSASSARTLLIPKAHAAAITGLVIVLVGGSTYWLASASIDQHVKLWRLEVDVEQPGLDGVKVRKLHDVFTAVADVSKLRICQIDDGTRYLLICGVGMDMWRLPMIEAMNDTRQT